MSEQEYFWVLPLGHHSFNKTEYAPWALKIECLGQWKWFASQYRTKLREHLRDQMNLIAEMWRNAFSKAGQAALVSSCAYPQGRFLEVAQEVQHLGDLQDTLGYLEGIMKVDVEYNDEPVLDYTHRPDPAVQKWGDMYLSHMAAVYARYGTVREHKDILIKVDRTKVPHDRKKFKEYMRPRLAKHEINGWQGDVSEGVNGHRYVSQTEYRVSFHRDVPAPTWPTEEETEE